MVDLKSLFKNKISDLKNNKFGQAYFEKVKALLPKEKPNVNIGLDIGSSYVKAVALKVEKEKAAIVNFSVRPLDKDDIVNSISKVLKDLDSDSKSVNVAVAGQGVVTRCVKFPRMSVSDVTKAIGFEAEKHIPFPLSEVYLDCVILKQIPEESKILVLVAAAKKELIQQRLGIIKKLDLSTNAIDIDSIALLNVVNRVEFKKVSSSADGEKTGQRKAVALINLGASFSSLCIIEDGLPRFVRDIFIGGNDLTKRISNILGIGIAEAEKAKCIPSEGWDKVIVACESVLNNLVNETRLSFDYFESESGIQISKLYLSGGGSYLKGIEDIFKSNLNVETMMFNPLVDINIGNGLKERLDSEARKLSVAIGLALRSK